MLSELLCRSYWVSRHTVGAYVSVCFFPLVSFSGAFHQLFGRPGMRTKSPSETWTWYTISIKKVHTHNSIASILLCNVTGNCFCVSTCKRNGTKQQLCIFKTECPYSFSLLFFFSSWNDLYTHIYTDTSFIVKPAELSAFLCQFPLHATIDFQI